jgi:hypothetical protein
VHHAAVFTHPAIFGVEIVDRNFTHLRHDRLRLVCSGSFNRTQVMPNGGISRIDLIPEFVAELVTSRVDVIYCSGDIAIRAAPQGTRTIPILGGASDMVSSGNRARR